MSVKIINEKFVGAGLNYIKNEKGMYFYYDNNLLIMHDAGMPFLTLIFPGKEIPLYGCNVIRNNDNEYTLEFYQGAHSVNCRIYERDGVITFLIENEKEYPAILITLYKEKYQKLIGVGQQRVTGNTAERKLSFYVENKYFFENVNIRKYDLKVLDKIFITAYQKRILFLIDTVNSPENLRRNAYNNIKDFKIVGRRMVFELTRDLYSLSDNRRDGIIVQDCEELDMADYLTEHYGSVIYRLRPEFRTDSHFVSYFSGKELIKQKNGLYKIDFTQPTAKLSFKTVIRKYFDTCMAGIYLDTSAYTSEELDTIKSAILSVATEYTKKIILYDRMPVTNDTYGYYVIRDRNKILRYPELIDFYKYSGEYFLAAEVKNYEEAKKVPDVCKIVIVNNML